MRVTKQVYLESVTDYGCKGHTVAQQVWRGARSPHIANCRCKNFTIALVDNADGTWSVARHHGILGAMKDWSLRPDACHVSHVEAEKVFDSLRREKERQGYTKESRIPSYLRYTCK